MSGESVVGDANCDRIAQLTTETLKKVATSDAGWTTLYLDPGDGRFWELTYPHSSWHGGSPPSLIHISDEQVEAKYR